MLKSLIFDFDGLILDTEYPEYLRWQRVFKEYGLDLPIGEWSAGIGKGSDSLLLTPYDTLEYRLNRPIDRAEIRERGRRYFAESMEGEQVLPGVDSLIADAAKRGLKAAIASSSPRQWVESYLSKFNLTERFTCIRCGDDVARAKPAPDLYLAALECVGCSPQEAIALEDSAMGIEAAKAAGLYCIAVPNRLTIHANLNRADQIVSSLTELSLNNLERIVSDP
jgi:HAD superfamily hydrolase (TIGR01509 family)